VDFVSLYPFIYHISISCPLAMHTYLLMWEHVNDNERGQEEGWNVFIDGDEAVRTYSLSLQEVVRHLMDLNRLGCIVIDSVTKESVLVTLKDVGEFFVYLEEEVEVQDDDI
jgi:hypothetical protein